MSDPREQLRMYVDAMYEPISADEVMSRSGGARAFAPRRRRLALVAASLALVVAVVGVLLVAGLHDGTPSRVNASATRSPSRGAWERVPETETGLEPGAVISTVVSFQGRLVAVGALVDLGSPTGPPFEAAVWSSDDGRQWSRAPSTSFGNGRFGTAVVMDGAVYAIASASDGDSSSVWASEDGLAWRQVTDAAPNGIQMVVEHDGLLVAGGGDTEHCGNRSTCLRPTVWTSDDGRTWSAHPSIGGVRWGYVSALTSTREGVVAVGTRLPQQASSSRRAQPLSWTSPDGRRWRAAPLDEAFGREAYVSSALATRGAQVLVLGVRTTPSGADVTTTTTTTRPPVSSTTPRGSQSTARLCAVLSGAPTAWRTSNGDDWHEFTPHGLEPDSSLNRLIAAHSWWLAAGSQGDCNGTRPTVFMSRDGRRWIEAIADSSTSGPPGDGSIRSVMAIAETTAGAVAVAGSLEGDAPDVWIWTAGA